MTLLACALVSDGNWSAQTMAAKIASDACRFDTLTPRPLHAEDQFALYLVDRHDKRGHALIECHSPEAGDEKVWLLGDCNYRAPDKRHLLQLTRDCAEGRGNQVPGRWILLRYDARARSLSVQTDRLGVAWTYMARVGGGYVFSSDYSALVSNLPHTPSLNVASLQAELMLGHIPDDTTIFEEVSLLPAGTTTEFGKRGIRRMSQRRPKYGDQFAGLSQEAKFEELDRIYDGIVARSKPFFHPDAVLSMSAGYDSRTALAVLARHGIEPALFTFGNPQGDEAIDAQSVCARVGRSTCVHVPGETSWVDWCKQVASLGNVTTLVYCGWVQPWHALLRAHGSSCINGFLGDAVSGKRLAPSHATEHDPVDGWVDWLARNQGLNDSPLIDPNTRRTMLASAKERVQSLLREGEFTFPHQRILHLDWYGRQRRHVAAQPNIISRFLTPALFFYDDELMNFWGNLPYSDLEHQRLYLAHNRSRFPAFFPTRGGGYLAEFQRKGQGLLKRLRAGRISGGTPPVLDHWRTVQNNRDAILELTGKTAPMVEGVLDMPAFRRYLLSDDGTREVAPRDMLRIVNLLILLSHAG